MGKRTTGTQTIDKLNSMSAADKKIIKGSKETRTVFQNTGLSSPKDTIYESGKITAY